jgi:Mlc titration factor MtfA (ptsG expression regulator)
MFRWLRARRPAPPIPQSLWQPLLQRYPFLAERPAADVTRLHALASEFLAQKEFHGAHGLVITDEMAAAIAAQAVLPVLHLERPGDSHAALRWYDDFVGIVVHPGEAVARREVMDDSGVVHAYDEVLAGEAMEGGPVMLSWPDVADAGASAEHGYNVVIHEFAHKIDMRDGAPDGCPPLPAGFMGAATARAAREAWLAVLQPAYDAFREKVIIAERFGGEPTWLDPYGSEALDEFFAVAAEAYFVNPVRFSKEFGGLATLFDAFFRPPKA